MSDWQPIETAPKDGTKVMVASVYGKELTHVDVDRYVTCASTGWWEKARSMKPIYWMPLPEPPPSSV